MLSRTYSANGLIDSLPGMRTGLRTHEPRPAREFHREVGQAIVLARLGALMHDFCHVPFGHSIEDELRIFKPHDRGEERFVRLWKTLPASIRRVLSGELYDNLVPMILTKRDRLGRPRYPFVEDMVGNTICADLLDYLRRDHLFTGLPIALGRRFEASFYVLPSDDPDFAENLVLRVHRDGHERKDAITEILKHLRYRYELSERALVHHAKLAADAMVGKALEMWFDTLLVENGSEQFRPEGGPDWPVGTSVDAVREALDARGPGLRARVSAVAKREIEDEMLERGDDGLLEYLRRFDKVADRAPVVRDHSRRRVVASLADDLLSRRLYKRIGRQSHIRKPREDFCRTWAPPDARRQVEQRAARFAEIEPAWHVLLWIPPPDMRLKVANVLVDDGVEVQRFVDRERHSGKRRGVDIYDAHEQLWEVGVYVHPFLARRRNQCRLILASLAADLDLNLLPDDDELRDRKPYEWPDRIALARLARRHHLRRDRVEELLRERRLRAARGGGRAQEAPLRPALSALIAEYEQLL